MRLFEAGLLLQFAPFLLERFLHLYVPVVGMLESLYHLPALALYGAGMIAFRRSLAPGKRAWKLLLAAVILEGLAIAAFTVQVIVDWTGGYSYGDPGILLLLGAYLPDCLAVSAWIAFLGSLANELGLETRLHGNKHPLSIVLWMLTALGWLYYLFCLAVYRDGRMIGSPLVLLLLTGLAGFGMLCLRLKLPKLQAN
jgi:hypothetical protein